MTAEEAFGSEINKKKCWGSKVCVNVSERVFQACLFSVVSLALFNQKHLFEWYGLFQLQYVMCFNVKGLSLIFFRIGFYLLNVLCLSCLTKRLLR